MGRPSFAPDTWDDLRMPLETVKVGSAAPPDYEVFRGDLKAYAFDDSRDEFVHFALQMPHRWKFGTSIRPHLHIGFPAATVNGETVRFELQYSVQSPQGGTFASQTQIGALYTIDTANAYDAQYGHTFLSLPPIDMTGHTASAMILCRLFRDVSEDDYAQDVSVFEFDVHFLSDSLGTVEELTRKP